MSAQHPDDSALLFEYDVPARRWTWSPGLRHLHGLAPGEPPTTQVMLDRMVLQDRNLMRRRFDEHLTTPGPFTCTYQMRDGDGHLRRIRYVGQSEDGGGTVKRIYGFVVDITEMLREHAAEAVAGAVQHRAQIEQAKGALMLSFAIDDEAAFDLLRGYSIRSNVKLSAVAERIVRGVSAPEYSREDPVRALLDILLDLEAQGAPEVVAGPWRQPPLPSQP